MPYFLEKGRSLLKELDEKVTFFGGSFNPWHDGHRACLELCDAANLIVVPDTNPFKVKEKGFEYKTCFWKVFKKMAIEMESTRYGFFPGFFRKRRNEPNRGVVLKVPFSERVSLLGMTVFSN